ncbi:MAG: hypothetical protein ACRD5G_03885 [Candidatus Acidiferrales bacterium]
MLLCFAGAHLLWLARHEVLYWMDTYLLLFRRSFDAARLGREPNDHRGGQPAPAVREAAEEMRVEHGLQERPRERSEMWLMLGGFALVGIGLAATGLVLVSIVVRRLS